MLNKISNHFVFAKACLLDVIIVESEIAAEDGRHDNMVESADAEEQRGCQRKTERLPKDRAEMLPAANAAQGVALLEAEEGVNKHIPVDQQMVKNQRRTDCVIVRMFY